MFYVVRTPPQMNTPRHAHTESVFRLLISGSLRINGRVVDKPGTYFVVKAGTPYQIDTDEGYVTLAGYGVHCTTQTECVNLYDVKVVEPKKP